MKHEGFIVVKLSLLPVRHAVKGATRSPEDGQFLRKCCHPQFIVTWYFHACDDIATVRAGIVLALALWQIQFRMMQQCCTLQGTIKKY